MQDPGFFLDVIKYAGFPGLIFIIFFIYHKAESQKWTQIISNHDNESKRVYDLLQETVNRQAKEEDRRFLLLQELTESVQMFGAALARVETKIDTNHFCPVTRNQKGR